MDLLATQVYHTLNIAYCNLIEPRTRRSVQFCQQQPSQMHICMQHMHVLFAVHELLNSYAALSDNVTM